MHRIFHFGWGSAPDPAVGAHSAPPDSLTGFEGVLLLREGNGREGNGREGKGGKLRHGFLGDGRPCAADHASIPDIGQ